MLSSFYGLSVTSAAACKKSLAWETVTEFQHFCAIAMGWLPCYETLKPQLGLVHLPVWQQLCLGTPELLSASPLSLCGQ